jgi:hypothetical protein
MYDFYLSKHNSFNVKKSIRDITNAEFRNTLFKNTYLHQKKKKKKYKNKYLKMCDNLENNI